MTDAADWRSYQRLEMSPADLGELVARNTWAIKPPIDSERAAQLLGVRVERRADVEWLGAARWFTTPAAQATIWLAEQTSEHLQQYAVAHLLGHILLSQAEGMVIVGNAAALQEPDVVNDFAIHLVMPDFLVVRFIHVPPSLAAAQFRVSDAAMDYRLQLLAL